MILKIRSHRVHTIGNLRVTGGSTLLPLLGSPSLLCLPSWSPRWPSLLTSLHLIPSLPYFPVLTYFPRILSCVNPLPSLPIDPSFPYFPALTYFPPSLTVRTHVILSPCDKVLSPFLSLPLLSALSPNFPPPDSLSAFLCARRWCSFCVPWDPGTWETTRSVAYVMKKPRQ